MRRLVLPVFAFVLVVLLNSAFADNPVPLQGHRENAKPPRVMPDPGTRPNSTHPFKPTRRLIYDGTRQLNDCDDDQRPFYQSDQRGAGRRSNIVKNRRDQENPRLRAYNTWRRPITQHFYRIYIHDNPSFRLNHFIQTGASQSQSMHNVPQSLNGPNLNEYADWGLGGALRRGNRTRTGKLQPESICGPSSQGIGCHTASAKKKPGGKNGHKFKSSVTKQTDEAVPESEEDEIPDEEIENEDEKDRKDEVQTEDSNQPDKDGRRMLPKHPVVPTPPPNAHQQKHRPSSASGARKSIGHPPEETTNRQNPPQRSPFSRSNPNQKHKISVKEKIDTNPNNTVIRIHITNTSPGRVDTEEKGSPEDSRYDPEDYKHSVVTRRPVTTSGNVHTSQKGTAANRTNHSTPDPQSGVTPSTTTPQSVGWTSDDSESGKPNATKVPQTSDAGPPEDGENEGVQASTTEMLPPVTDEVSEKVDQPQTAQNESDDGYTTQTIQDTSDDKKPSGKNHTRPRLVVGSKIKPESRIKFTKKPQSSDSSHSEVDNDSRDLNKTKIQVQSQEETDPDAFNPQDLDDGDSIKNETKNSTVTKSEKNELTRMNTDIDEIPSEGFEDGGDLKKSSDGPWETQPTSSRSSQTTQPKVHPMSTGKYDNIWKYSQYSGSIPQNVIPEKIASIVNLFNRGKSASPPIYGKHSYEDILKKKLTGQLRSLFFQPYYTTTYNESREIFRSRFPVIGSPNNLTPNNIADTRNNSLQTIDGAAPQLGSQESVNNPSDLTDERRFDSDFIQDYAYDFKDAYDFHDNHK